jgi:hypothetical protein
MSSTTTGEYATMHGGNAILTCTGQQKEKWIKDKVGKGDYLEDIVRHYFDVIQASQTSQQGECPYSAREVEDAARGLHYLDGLKIRYPARVHAKYVPVPNNDENSIEFKGRQYKRWLELNEVLGIVRKGEDVEMTQRQLDAIWAQTLYADTSASESEEDEDWNSDLIPPAPQHTEIDLTVDFEESKRQNEHLLPEYEVNVRVWKKERYKMANQYMSSYVGDTSYTAQYGHPGARRNGDPSRAVSWLNEWTEACQSHPGSALSICPSGKNFLALTGALTGPLQRKGDTVGEWLDKW